MYHSEPHSISQYIRKRVAKKLPIKRSLPTINEIAQALEGSHRDIMAERVANLTSDHRGNDLQTMDIVESLALGSPYPGLTNLDILKLNSNDRNPDKTPVNGKNDVRTLAQIAYRLLTGVRPIIEDGHLVDCVLDGKSIVQQDLNRCQRRALENALAADQDRQTSSIQSFLQELNGVPLKPSFQHLGISMVLLFASVGGLLFWKLSDTDRTRAPNVALKNLAAKNKNPSFASFETNKMSNYVPDAATTSASSNELFRIETTNDLEKQSWRQSTGSRYWKNSLTEKVRYMDEVAAAYRKILKIDPTNKTAKRGLKNIGDKYAQLIRSIRDTGNRQLSIELNNHSLSQVPKHTQLLALQDELQNLPTKRALDASALKTIRRLMDEAKDHIKASRYILPKEKNAVETYKKILRLDPQNNVALNGLNKMAMVFENAAREKFESGQLAESEALIEQGLMIRPQHHQLLSLREIVANASTKHYGHSN